MNRLRDELRRHARGPSRVELDDAALSERSWLEETVGLETITAYEEALRQLKPEEREAVIGRVELGLTYDELIEPELAPLHDHPRVVALRKRFNLP